MLRGQPVAPAPEDELALVTRGLADRVDGRLRPRSPARAAERWVADRTVEIAQVREGVEYYASLHSREQGTFVEVVRGIDQVRIAAQQLQESATVLVRGFDREPYFSDEIIVDPAQSPAIDRGISYQVVYRQSALSDPRVLKTVRAAVEMGEEARSSPDLPMRMSIVDDTVALLVLPLRGDSIEVDGLVVRRSPLLDSLIAMFDAFWNRAIPLDLALDDGSDQENRRIIALLAAGLTDRSIARELGVSERTVHRRIGRLQDQLGGPSRFLLGVQAARQGWI